MSECPNEMQLTHTAQLATMKNDISNMKRTLADLSEIKDTLVELKILNAQAIKFNERQTQNNEEVKDTLSKINLNLDGLNKRVGSLEKEKEITDSQNFEEDMNDRTVQVSRKYNKITAIGVIAATVISIVGVIISIFKN